MLNKFEILILFICINCVKCFNMSILHLPEGSNCTYEDKPGKCVNFFKCERLVVDMPEKRHPPICSFDGKVPIVCCTSCTLVDNINDAIKVSSGLIYWKNGDKSHDQCLEYSRLAKGKCAVIGGVSLRYDETKQCDKLFGMVSAAAGGGRDATVGEMPHMALLGYGSELASLDWLCGGTLLSDKFILTAGHCTKSDLLGSVTYVALGILRRTDPLETWQQYGVKTIIPHPEYKPPAKYHDIALLETKQRIKLSSLVIPACLPNPKLFVNDDALDQDYEKVFEGNLKLAAAGWGATGFRRPMANTLQVIEVKAFTETECLEHYPPRASIPHGYNKTTQLCFGDKEKPVDTCEGDSGGPLQYFDEAYCMFTVMGVTSFGHACGFAGNAGIYTRVVHYVPWIEDIIWK